MCKGYALTTDLFTQWYLSGFWPGGSAAERFHRVPPLERNLGCEKTPGGLPLRHGEYDGNFMPQPRWDPVARFLPLIMSMEACAMGYKQASETVQQMKTNAGLAFPKP